MALCNLHPKYNPRSFWRFAVACTLFVVLPAAPYMANAASSDDSIPCSNYKECLPYIGNSANYFFCGCQDSVTDTGCWLYTSSGSFTGIQDGICYEFANKPGKACTRPVDSQTQRQTDAKGNCSANQLCTGVDGVSPNSSNCFDVIGVVKPPSTSSSSPTSSGSSTSATPTTTNTATDGSSSTSGTTMSPSKGSADNSSGMGTNKPSSSNNARGVDEDSDSPKSMSAGAIIAIAVGITALLAVSIALFLFLRKKKHNDRGGASNPDHHPYIRRPHNPAAPNGGGGYDYFKEPVTGVNTHAPEYAMAGDQQQINTMGYHNNVNIYDQNNYQPPLPQMNLPAADAAHDVHHQGEPIVAFATALPNSIADVALQESRYQQQPTIILSPSDDPRLSAPARSGGLATYPIENTPPPARTAYAVPMHATEQGVSRPSAIASDDVRRRKEAAMSGGPPASTHTGISSFDL